YLDGGFDKSTEFVSLQYADLLANLDPAKTLKDPKTRLQEWLQARRYALPKYTVQETTGAAHAQQFSILCELTRPKLQSIGLGASRRQAEQIAASLLLDKLEAYPA
ncbi:MAG: ribonuclease, partial [Pseudomonadota bacterium]